jgi:hypothetical protein
MTSTVAKLRSAFAFDDDKWISYSHWGMFPARRRLRNSRGEA